MANTFDEILRRTPGRGVNTFDQLNPGGNALTEEELLAGGGTAESDFARGVTSALRSMTAGNLSRGALDAELAGSPDAPALKERAMRESKMASLAGPRVGRVEDIGGVGDALNWFGGAVGQGLTSTLPPLAGAIGARLLPGVGRLRATPYIGAAVPSYGMMKGEHIANQYQDPVIANLPAEQREAAATRVGLGGAALEALMPGSLLTRGVVRPGVRAGLRHVGKQVAEKSLLEGGTEVGQELLGQHELSALNPRRDSSGDTSALINAFASGAAGGSPFGVGSGALDLVGPNIRAAGDATARGERRVVDLTAEAASRAVDAGVDLGDRALDLGKRAVDLGGEGFLDRVKDSRSGRTIVDLGSATGDFAADVGERVKTVAGEAKSPADFARRVFIGAEPSTARRLVAGDSAPRLVGSTPEATAQALEQNATELTQLAQAEAQTLLNDPKASAYSKSVASKVLADPSNSEAQRQLGLVLGTRSFRFNVGKWAKSWGDKVSKLAGKTKLSQQAGGQNELLDMLDEHLHEEARASDEVRTLLPELASNIANLVLGAGDAKIEDVRAALQDERLGQIFTDPGKLFEDVESLYKAGGSRRARARSAEQRDQAMAEIETAAPEAAELTDLIKGFEKTRGRLAASSPAETDAGKPNSFLYRRLTPEAQDTIKSGHLKQLGRYIDELLVSTRTPRAATMAALVPLFGSETSVEQVLDHYGARHEAQREVYEPAISGDTEAETGEISESDETVGEKQPTTAEPNVDTEPRPEYVFENVVTRLPRYARHDNRIDDRKRVARQLIRAAKAVRGPEAEVEVVTSLEFAKDRGFDPQKYAADLSQRYARRAKSLRDKSPERRMAEDDKEAALMEWLAKGLKDASSTPERAELALNRLHVARASAGKADDLVASDEDIEGMRWNVEKGKQDTGSITFKRKDGGPFKLSTIGMVARWERRSAKADLRSKTAQEEAPVSRAKRMFLESFAGVLARPDVIGIEGELPQGGMLSNTLKVQNAGEKARPLQVQDAMQLPPIETMSPGAERIATERAEKREGVTDIVEDIAGRQKEKVRMFEEGISGEQIPLHPGGAQPLRGGKALTPALRTRGSKRSFGRVAQSAEEREAETKARKPITPASSKMLSSKRAPVQEFPLVIQEDAAEFDNRAQARAKLRGLYSAIADRQADHPLLQRIDDAMAVAESGDMTLARSTAKQVLSAALSPKLKPASTAPARKPRPAKKKTEAATQPPELLKAAEPEPEPPYEKESRTAGVPGPTRRLDPAEKAAAIAEAERLLGPQVQTLYTDLLNGIAAGTFAVGRANAQRVEKIKLANVLPLAVSANEVAWHESMHGLISRLNGDFANLASNPKVRAAREMMLSVGSSPMMLKRMEPLLKDFPDALKAAREDPEEALAYMYQFWAAGKLRVTTDAQTLFQKIAKFIRGLLGVVSESEKVEALLAAFHKGSFADPRFMGPVLDSMNQETTAEKFRRVAGPIAKVAERLTSNTTDRLRDFDIPALADLADKFDMAAGQERGELGFLQDRSRQTGVWRNKLAGILEGSTPVERAEVLEAFQSMTVPTSAQARQLYNEVDQFLKDMHEYMHDRGVRLGRTVVHPNGSKEVVYDRPVRRVKKYFPRVWDKEAIRARQAAFIELLRVEGGLDPQTASDTVNTILSSDGYIDLAENEHHVGYTPYSQALQERKLNFIKQANAAKFAPFQQKDVVGAMSTYLYQAVHRAEYAARFGNEGEVIQEAMAKAREQGASDDDIADANKSVRGLEGTLNYSFNPRLRELFSDMIVYQNIALLPFTLFSSLIDPLGIAVRTGEMGDAWDAFKDGMKGLWKQLRRDNSFDWQEELAKTIGLVDEGNMLELMGNLYNGMYMSKAAKRWNEKFFRWNGMEVWNQRMRTSAMMAGMRFFTRHSLGTQNGNETSLRYMKELGLEAGDIQQTQDGHIKMLQDQGLTPEQEMRVQSAMFRFVDSAILRPSAAQRPLWGSDPAWSLIFHLKQFTFSFQRTIMRRAGHEARHGNNAPAQMLASYVPFMIAADFMRGGLTGNLKEGWDLVDYMGAGIERSGVMGVGAFGADALQDAARGGTPGASFLGPTVQHATDILQLIAGDKEESLKKVLYRSLPAGPAVKSIVE